MRGLAVAVDLALPLDYTTHRIAMLAKPRVGKSNAAVRLFEEMYRNGIPAVAIDPKGDWWGIRSSSDGEGPGLSVPIFGGEHGDLPLDPRSGKVIGELIAQKRLSCLLDISQFETRQEMWGFLIDLGTALLRHNRDPLHIFLDECDEYLPQKVSEKGNQPKCLGVWSRVVSKGGQKGIGVSLISQRSAFVNKDVLWIVDAMFAFNTFSPADRKTITEWFADKGVSSREFSESLRTLEKGEAWMYAPGWLNDEPQRVRFERRTTFDSGATPEVGHSAIVPVTAAEIDLEALGATIAATVEQAKATDPKHLQARIRELEREVATAGNDAETIRRQTDREQALEAELAEACGENDRLLAQNNALAQRLADIAVRAAEIEAAAGGVWGIASDSSSEAVQPARATRAQGPSRVESPKAVHPAARADAAAAARQATATTPARAARTPDGDGTTLGKSERAVLSVLAQFGPCDKGKLALLAGYRWSGGFRNTLSALRTAGYIEGANTGVMTITEGGLAALGEYEPLPSGRALLDYWLQDPRLGTAERDVLEHAYEFYPETESGEQAAEHLGRQYSGGFRNVLSKLRTAGLIEGPNAAFTASPLFFEGGR